MIKTFICVNEDCTYYKVHGKQREHKTLAAQERKMCDKCRKKMKEKG